jgi:hypothetical protein
MMAQLGTDPRPAIFSLVTELISTGSASSPAEIEGWLREMGSQIHLLAVELRHYPPEDRVWCIYTWQADEAPEYALWVGKEGDAEARKYFDLTGISPEENLERLVTAGILLHSPDGNPHLLDRLT